MLVKTKCMIFHTNHRKFVYPNLAMNDEIIERVTSFNFLGLMLSANLSWDVHTGHISRKVSRAIGVIKSLKYAFPIETLITIYNTLLLCHFNYCLTVWGSNTDKLFRLQKKAIRIISNNSYLTHTDPIFKRLGLLKINDIYILRVLKLYYKLKHNVLPPLFNDMLPRISIGSTRYGLRCSSFQLPMVRHDFAKRGLQYNIVKIINTTHNDILDKIHTHSLYGYAYYIKHNFLQNYINECTIQNCYVCDSTL